MADQGRRCRLALEICAVGFGVQPAAPAEEGQEVSPFLGHAGSARIACGQGSQALLSKQELQIIAICPFLQRNELWC